MAINKIKSGSIEDDAITSAKVSDGVISAADVADGTLTNAKLADGTIENAKLAGSIANDKLANSSITLNGSAVSLGGTASIASGMFRNIIINGDMNIAQRGTSVSSVTSTGYRAVDRFRIAMSSGSAGTWTISQSTDVPSGQGFAKSMKMDCTTANASLSANDNLALQHHIEGQNLQYLKYGTSSAESLTLSFWVKSNKTGTYTVEFEETGNVRHFCKTYTIDSASTWEKKTITISGDTASALANDNTLELRPIWWLGAGSNFTSGTLNTSGWSSQTTANRVSSSQVNLADSTSNEWYITGVQLEAGTTASDFEFLPHDVNLGRCLRYFSKTYALSTAPGTAVTTNKIETSGFSDQANNIVHYIPHKVRMRTTPTITFYKADGTSGQWDYGRNGATGGGTATAYTSRNADHGITFYINIGASWTGAYINGHYKADAEL